MQIVGLIAIGVIYWEQRQEVIDLSKLDMLAREGMVPAKIKVARFKTAVEYTCKR